jgi:RNA polymerase sigma-70 factor (ECF subfamily)
MRRAFDEPREHEHPDTALVRAFARACEMEDVGGFAVILRHDVTVVVDGGGVAVTAEPVQGAGVAVGLLLRVLWTIPDSIWAVQSVNGSPGVVARRERKVIAVVGLDARRARISAVWLILNPQKLEHWNRTATDRDR